MAKKNMTAVEVGSLVAAAADAAYNVTAIQEATSKMRVEDIPDAIGLVHSLIVAARDLNQTALSLMSRHSLQETTAKDRTVRKAVASRRQVKCGQCVEQEKR